MDYVYRLGKRHKSTPRKIRIKRRQYMEKHLRSFKTAKCIMPKHLAYIEDQNRSQNENQPRVNCTDTMERNKMDEDKERNLLNHITNDSNNEYCINVIEGSGTKHNNIDGDVDDDDGDDDDDDGDADDDNDGDTDDDNGGDNSDNNGGDNGDNNGDDNGDNGHTDENEDATLRIEQEEELNDDCVNVFSIKKKKSLSESVKMKKNIKKLDVIASVISVAVRSHFTYVAIKQMLRNINRMLEDEPIPRTLIGLWSLLSRDDTMHTTRYYYCESCLAVIGKGKENLEICECTDSVPKTDRKSVPYFIHVSITSQLQQLFKIPSICDLLQYPYTRKKNDADAIEDIYDGKEYQKLCQPGGFLSNKHNYSFTLNTDGCKVTKSSNASAWPILLEINELPPHARKRYILLAGIWVDAKHPDLNTILNPVALELYDLYNNGIEWKHPVNNGIKTRSKFVTVTCTVDTPARADILNATRFNGKYGCTFCYNKGQGMMNNPKNRVYPIDEASLRTDQEMREHMQEAFETGERVFGIKGYSVLQMLQEFDLGTGIVNDSMHNLYLGVVKFHTSLLISGKANNPSYIGTPKNRKTINNILMSIRRPTKISRSPKPIEEMADWKANQWRDWVLYYMLPCLEGLADENEINILALLSNAAYTLNKDCITQEELEKARSDIDKYVMEFQRRFGIVKMRYNVHLLIHLPDTVANWGPIWANNAFPFESWNRKVIDRVTSANSRCLQIVTRHMMETFLQGLIDDATVSQITKTMITETLTDGNKALSRMYIQRQQQTNSKFSGIGKGKSRSPSDWESQALNDAEIDVPKTLNYYESAIIHSIHYKRSSRGREQKETRYCNEYVHCKTHGFAKILDIVRFRANDSGNEVHGLFLLLLTTLERSFQTEHITKVRISSTKVFVRTVEESPKPTIVIDNKKSLFAIKLANVWETD